MASTFSELYSDFKDALKEYTENLDVTELSFMRMLTRGMQIFQRETEYIERVVKITINANPPYFVIPRDMLRLVEIRDINQRPLLIQKYEQWSRNDEKGQGIFLETPTDYDLRLVPNIYDTATRLATIWGRELITQPNQAIPNDTEFTIYYIPDIHAYNNDINGQWALWQPYDINFMPNFTTMGVSTSLRPYENCFLDYAISLFIKRKGSASYKVFEQSFWDEIERAKINKPDLFQEGVRSYFFAPYS